MHFKYIDLKRKKCFKREKNKNEATLKNITE